MGVSAADIPCLLMPSPDVEVYYADSGFTHSDFHINYQDKRLFSVMF